MLSTFETVLFWLDMKGQKNFGAQWQAMVDGQVAALEAAYKLLFQQDRDPIDYSELSVQAAYLYAYAMPRAYFTYEFLKRH